MKKRIIGLILALTLLLLGGCTEDPQQNPTVTTAGIASLEEYREKVIAAADVVTYDAEPLLEYDPDREVYISLANADCDYFSEYWFSQGNVVVITKEHYDPAEIQVNIPMETKYIVEVMDVTDWCSAPAYRSEQSKYGLQLYQYMCMQGADWQEIGKLQAYADSALNLLRQDLGNADKGEEKRAYTEIANMYNEEIRQILEKHEADYQKLSQKEIPKFGAYIVSIKFDTNESYFDETVGTAEFVIGGKSYPVDFGQWRLHETCPQELMDGFEPIGLKQNNIVRATLATSAYIGNNTYIPGAFTFQAEEDLTITGVHQVGVQLDILGAQVTVGDQASYFWKMDIPIEVKKGEKVEIELYLRDDRFGEYDVCITAYPAMDYEIRGKAYSMPMPCLLLRWDMHCWDTYLMAFEGIDVGPYYACYLDPMNDSWLEALPKSWLE